MSTDIAKSINKMIPVIILVAVIAGGGGFYSGMKYGQSKVSSSGQNDFRNFANMTPEQRQQRMQQFGANGGTRTGTPDGQRGMMGGVVGGEIISKDDKSVTVKLRDGGSKLIFLSDSTEVVRSVSSTANDLEVGKNISVNGTTNSDGSMTAQTIQVR